MRQIGTIEGCDLWEDGDGRVYFVADADIDADGANGQDGAEVAYRGDDTGSEALANGGMAIKNGKVVCVTSGARDIAILGKDNEPRVYPGGMIATKTWYAHPGLEVDDPAAYVDAQTVPYIVVPPLVVKETIGVGCLARVTWGGTSVDCVVADRGPKAKIGESSIAAAEALGIPSSPRNGGRLQKDIEYELWPGARRRGTWLRTSARVTIHNPPAPPRHR